MKKLILPLVMFVTSCTVGPNYVRPSVRVPDAYNQSDKKPASKRVVKQVSKQWWTLFHSKPLTQLVETSFQQNPVLSSAVATLHGALENVYAQEGALYPFVGLLLNPAKQQTAKLLTSVLASNQYNYSLYTGQVFVSYTPDVFGGIRRQLESLIAQARYQRFQLEATYLTLSSNVVNAAIQEASLRAQLRAVKQVIKSQKNILKITHSQLALGDTSQADIALQETALANTESQLPILEKQLAIQRDLLNALTGHLPDDALPKFELTSLRLPTTLPLSLPSCLLEQRPDIRAAEEQMRSANALIGVAKSNRLPNVTIGFTNAGAAATNLGDLFAPETLFWSLAGIITQPIFDGGALLHKQRYAQAMYDQAAAQYRATVINAFQNVSDTLKSIQSDAVALHIAQRAEKSAKRSLRIAQSLFKTGDSSLVAVLLAEQLYQQAQLNLIQAQTNRLTDMVALFQALGGGRFTVDNSPSHINQYDT